MVRLKKQKFGSIVILNVIINQSALTVSMMNKKSLNFSNTSSCLFNDFVTKSVLMIVAVHLYNLSIDQSVKQSIKNQSLNL